MGNINLAGGLVTQQFVKTYTTFSGVDITALFDDMTLMTLQGIAVSITREKVPVYSFGRARPVSISRIKFPDTTFGDFVPNYALIAPHRPRLLLKIMSIFAESHNVCTESGMFSITCF